jgi:copper chaperone CopZ
LKKTDGVREAKVSFPKGEAWVRYDDRKVTVAKLKEVIDGTGFKAAGTVKAAKARGKRRAT